MCFFKSADSIEHRINGPWDWVRWRLDKEAYICKVLCFEGCNGCKFYLRFKCCDPKINPDVSWLVWADKPVNVPMTVSNAPNSNPPLPAGLLSN